MYDPNKPQEGAQEGMLPMNYIRSMEQPAMGLLHDMAFKKGQDIKGDDLSIGKVALTFAIPIQFQDMIDGYQLATQDVGPIKAPGMTWKESPALLAAFVANFIGDGAALRDRDLEALSKAYKKNPDVFDPSMAIPSKKVSQLKTEISDLYAKMIASDGEITKGQAESMKRQVSSSMRGMDEAGLTEIATEVRKYTGAKEPFDIDAKIRGTAKSLLGSIGGKK